MVRLASIARSELFRHLAHKVLLLLPLLWGVVTLTFVLLELSPGSVIDKFINEDTSPEVRERLVAKWHLEDPAPVRYVHLVENMARLDFGVSIDQERPVFDIIAERLPNTLLLSTVSLLTMYPVGILLGVLQAVREGRAADTGISLVSFFFYSMPSFWLALMLQLLLCYWWPLLPTSGMFDDVQYDYLSAGGQVWDRVIHLVLPGLAMGVAHSAAVARYTRSALLEVVRQDYIRTARAKGVSEVRIILVHALRNALLPIITLFGLSLPTLFAGSVLVETIFAWPGMGRLMVQAILSEDTPLIIGCFFVYTLVVSLGGLLAEVLYSVADPRIRYQ